MAIRMCINCKQNFDSFSLVNHRQFVKFAKLSLPTIPSVQYTVCTSIDGYSVLYVQILLHHTETIEIIQRNTDSKHESEKPSTAATPKAPPERPPYKYLPFHPACKLS